MLNRECNSSSGSNKIVAQFAKYIALVALFALTTHSFAACEDDLGPVACSQLAQTKGGGVRTVIDEPLPGIPWHMKWARNGKYFVISSQSLVKRVDALDGKSLISFQLRANDSSHEQTDVIGIDISTDSAWITLLHRNGVVSVWDAARGSLVSLTMVPGNADSIAFMDKVDEYRSDRPSNNRFKSGSMLKFQEQTNIIAVSRRPDATSGSTVSLAFIDWLDVKSGKAKPYGENKVKTLSLNGVNSVSKIMPLMSSIHFDISYGMQLNLLQDDGSLIAVTMLGGKPEMERLRAADKDAFTFCLAERVSIAGGVDCRNLEPLIQIEPVQHYGVAAVVAGDNISMNPEVRLYPARNKARQKELPEKLEISEPAIKVGWSPDGTRLAIGGQGGGIYLYNTKNWRLIRGRE